VTGLRRLIVASAVGLLGATTCSTALAVSATTHDAAAKSLDVDHVGPDAVAWYDASRPVAAAPAAPMPGVGPKNLLVSGLTINTALLPISLPIPPIRQVTAFAALSFKLPEGATPASLTLHLTGLDTTLIARRLPSGVTPIACLATSRFKSGAQQPMSAAPKYDCSKRSTVGQLGISGKTVTFPGISRLLTGDTLSVVILPGSLGLERLVFAPPTNRTLSLLSFDEPAPIETPTIPPADPPAAPADQGAGSVPDLPSVPPVPAVEQPPAPAPTPSIAPSPDITTVALAKPDDTRDRTAALGLLVALVVAGLWLAVTDRGRSQAQEMGIGRFRSTRSGPPPTV
jgi:hypothetical protein